VIELDREVSDRELLWFGVTLPIVFGVVGGIVLWRTESMTAASVLWTVGVLLGFGYFALPPFRRLIYRGWMRAFYPIGWTISHVLLGGIFYLLLTPIGLTMRLLGRAPFAREFDREMQSHWEPRDPRRETKRYFKQF